MALFIGMGLAWTAAGAEDWRRMPAPGVWEKADVAGLKDYNGFAWYRCFVIVPKAWEGANPKLHLGTIDDCDETYLNGVLIGRTGEFPPKEISPDIRKDNRIYALPNQVLKYGAENTLVVRVLDVAGSGGMLGLPYVRIKRQE